MKKMMVGGLVAGMVFGAMATSFSYQGVLKNATGGDVENKSPTISFRLYTQASGGTAQWGKTFAVTLDDNGLFTLELTDSGSAISGLTNTLDNVLAAYGQGNLYLGLTVTGSSGEITPRQKLLPVPVASFAQNADAAKGDFTVTGHAVFNGTITANAGAELKGTTRVEKLETSGGASLGGAVKVTGSLTAQGGLSIPSGQGLKLGENDLIPSGTIWMWYGDANSLPEGWVLCNGQNGTPDLRDRFPVGAGLSYAKGDKGGEATHQLTTAEMPSHTHEFTLYTYDIDDGWKDQDNLYTPAKHRDDFKHTTTTTAAGGDQPHENRPPYLAIYFIMKK